MKKKVKQNKIKLLDCTLRDGGYYNNWDFENDLVREYLLAMDDLNIDFVEIGFRTLKNNNFVGGFAFSTDVFLNSLEIPKGLKNKIAVMINGSEISSLNSQISNLEKLFSPKAESPVSLVRIACHFDEFINCLPASKWLKKMGYLVGFNIMQIAEISKKNISKLAKAASKYPIDILYFADSMGSLNLPQLKNIISAFKKEWHGPLGIHTHDNIGLAVNNSIESIKYGVNWIDATVTGMGRGPGNAQTEYLALELGHHQKKRGNSIKLMEVITKYFKPLKNKYEWGINYFYYLAGKKSIHPSYIQEMLKDLRYKEEDILAVIDFLSRQGGKKFKIDTLENARNFYYDKPLGKWQPQKLIKGKTVLIIGSGPGAIKYQFQIENFIKQYKPYVIALNTQSSVKEKLINARAACHPVRLLADCKDHAKLTQPLIAPFSMLPEEIKKKLIRKKIYDFGIKIIDKNFSFFKNYCQVPSSLVIAYTLAVANSGKAASIVLAGFDGYRIDDPRYREINQILKAYIEAPSAVSLKSITPTNYNIKTESVFGLKF